MFQLILKAYQVVAVMSALGQKQTYAAQKAMSALPSKADMCGKDECPLRANSGHGTGLRRVRALVDVRINERCRVRPMLAQSNE